MLTLNPLHTGTRWGSVGKRKEFEGNPTYEGVANWVIFVFNRPQVRGLGKFLNGN